MGYCVLSLQHWCIKYYSRFAKILTTRYAVSSSNPGRTEVRSMGFHVTYVPFADMGKGWKHQSQNVITLIYELFYDSLLEVWGLRTSRWVELRPNEAAAHHQSASASRCGKTTKTEQDVILRILEGKSNNIWESECWFARDTEELLQYCSCSFRLVRFGQIKSRSVSMEAGWVEYIRVYPHLWTLGKPAQTKSAVF